MIGFFITLAIKRKNTRNITRTTLRLLLFGMGEYFLCILDCIGCMETEMTLLKII